MGRALLLAPVAGAAAAALLLWPAPARTGPPPPRFQLVWMREGNADGCPSPRQAREQVRSWLGRDPFSDEAEQVIEAAVREQGGRFWATVRVRDGQGRPRGSRSFDDAGPGCAAIARAALLAVVLTIDPDAPPSPPPPASAPPPASVPPAASAPAAASAPQDASAPTAASAPPAASALPPPPASAPPAPSGAAALVSDALDRVLTPPDGPPPAAADRRGWRGEVAVGGGAALGWLPGPGGVATLRGATRALDWLAVEAGARWLPLRRSDDRTASFGLTAAELGACAIPLEDGGGAVEACAALGLGSMTAVVHRLEPLEPGSTLWTAALLGVRGRLDLPGALFVRLGAELALPLRRLDYRITAGSPRTVFSTPAAGGSLGLELGAHFR